MDARTSQRTSRKRQLRMKNRARAQAGLALRFLVGAYSPVNCQHEFPFWLTTFRVQPPESSKKNQPSHLRFLTIASVIFRAGWARQYTGSLVFDWFAQAPA